MQVQETQRSLPDPPEDDNAPPARLRPRDLGKARNMTRRRNKMYASLMGCPPLVIPWLVAMGAQRRAACKEGAHAEQSLTG
jgi:hypothetical protein